MGGVERDRYDSGARINERLNTVLNAEKFDQRIEAICRKYYKLGGGILGGGMLRRRELDPWFKATTEEANQSLALLTSLREVAFPFLPGGPRRP